MPVPSLSASSASCRRLGFLPTLASLLVLGLVGPAEAGQLEMQLRESWLGGTVPGPIVGLFLVTALSAAMALAYSRLVALIAAIAGTYGGTLLFAIATSGLDMARVSHNNGGAFLASAAGHLLLSGVLPSVILSLGMVMALDREVREWLVQGGQVSVDGLPSALQATIQAYKSTLPPPARRRLERRGMISCRMLVQLEAKDRAAIERATRRIAAQTENLQRLQAIEEEATRQEMLEGASNLERAVMELRNEARARIAQLKAEIHALQAENRRLCRAVRPAS